MMTFLRAASVVFLTTLAAKLLIAGAGAAVSNTTDTNIPRIYSHSERTLIHATFTEMSVSIVAGVNALTPGSIDGDGSLATEVTLDYPNWVTLDAKGNIFISEAANNRIRKVDKNTGIISTVAGGRGRSAFSGDGGLATLAGISNPFVMIFDLFGDLFFSDVLNKRIRKITTSTGIINTVVGTGSTEFNGEDMLGTSASVALVAGLACDSEGNLFYTDFEHKRIRKLTRNTGIVKTVAGTGNFAGMGTNFNNVEALKTNINPTSMIIDASGNLYFTSNSFGTGFLKLTMTTGIITTVETYDRVGSLLIDGSGSIYYAKYYGYIGTSPSGSQVFSLVKIGAGGSFEIITNNLVEANPTYVDAAGALYAYTRYTVLKFTQNNFITAPPSRQPTLKSVPPTCPLVTVTAPPTRQLTPPPQPRNKPTKCPRGKKPSRKPRSPSPR